MVLRRKKSQLRDRQGQELGEAGALGAPCSIWAGAGGLLGGGSRGTGACRERGNLGCGASGDTECIREASSPSRVARGLSGSKGHESAVGPWARAFSSGSGLPEGPLSLSLAQPWHLPQRTLRDGVAAWPQLLLCTWRAWPVGEAVAPDTCLHQARLRHRGHGGQQMGAGTGPRETGPQEPVGPHLFSGGPP